MVMQTGYFKILFFTKGKHVKNGKSVWEENVLTPQNDNSEVQQINMIIMSAHSKFFNFSGVKSLNKVQ
jgi:hypothetical protein